MFKRFLILQLLLCGGIIGARAYFSLPDTRLTVGDTTVTVRSVPTEDPAPAPPAPLPTLGDNVVFPVRGYGPADVISGFGDRRGKTRLHQGIDVKAPRGTPVVATVAGFVERIRQGGSGGKQLYLRDGRGRLYYYAHLDDWSVEEFAAVEPGQQLGTVGDTGNARGTTPHLHFEILLGKERRAVDPLAYWAIIP